VIPWQITFVFRLTRMLMTSWLSACVGLVLIPEGKRAVQRNVPSFFPQCALPEGRNLRRWQFDSASSARTAAPKSALQALSAGLFGGRLQDFRLAAEHDTLSG
jgi:hypothetical protein